MDKIIKSKREKCKIIHTTIWILLLNSFYSSGPLEMCLNNLSFEVTQLQPTLTVMFLTVLTCRSSSDSLRLSRKTTSILVLSCLQENNLDFVQLVPGLSQTISVMDSEIKSIEVRSTSYSLDVGEWIENALYE